MGGKRALDTVSTEPGCNHTTMKRPAKYAKRLPGDPYHYVPLESDVGEDTPLELRVTLGEMALEDAFSVTLPSSYGRLRVAEFIDQVFPPTPQSQAMIRRYFDLKANPDLPEMYGSLLEVFSTWRSGRCTLRLFANNGPEIELADDIRRHLLVRQPGAVADRSTALLDLVVEQAYSAMDYAVRKGYAESRRQLLEWLRSHTMLYFMTNHGHLTDAEPASEDDTRLLPIANALCRRGFLTPVRNKEAFALTRQGTQVMAGMMSEAASYVERFDVFKDVLYRSESQSVEFDTGRGDDLRAQVYEAEGLDPVRVVFLLRLYDSTLDDFASEWREAIHDEGFFDEMLTPVVDHATVGDSLLDWIIESGLAYVEEQGEESRRLARDREVLARARDE